MEEKKQPPSQPAQATERKKRKGVEVGAYHGREEIMEDMGAESPIKAC